MFSLLWHRKIYLTQTNQFNCTPHLLVRLKKLFAYTICIRLCYCGLDLEHGEYHVYICMYICVYINVIAIIVLRFRNINSRVPLTKKWILQLSKSSCQRLTVSRGVKWITTALKMSSSTKTYFSAQTRAVICVAFSHRHQSIPHFLLRSDNCWSSLHSAAYFIIRIYWEHVM